MKNFAWSSCVVQLFCSVNTSPSDGLNSAAMFKLYKLQVRAQFPFSLLTARYFLLVQSRFCLPPVLFILRLANFAALETDFWGHYPLSSFFQLLFCIRISANWLGLAGYLLYFAQSTNTITRPLNRESGNGFIVIWTIFLAFSSQMATVIAVHRATG